MSERNLLIKQQPLTNKVGFFIWPYVSQTDSPGMVTNEDINAATTQLDLAKEIGAAYVVIGGMAKLDQKNNSYVYSDQVISYALSLGLKVIVLLDGAMNTAAYPSVLDDYVAQAIKFIQHFAGRGLIYQGWNEPNQGQWFGQNIFTDATQQTLIGYDRKLYDAVKQYDPQSIFLTGVIFGTINALDGGNWSNFFDVMVKNGLLESGDALAMHPYLSVYSASDKPETMLKEMVNDQVTIPIVSTEFGLPSPDNLDCNYSDSHNYSEQTQSDYLAREFFIQDLLGQPIMIQYQLFETSQDGNGAFSIIRRPYDDPQWRPAALLLKSLFAQLHDYQLIQRINTSSDNDFLLDYALGPKHKLVYWTADSQHELNYHDQSLVLTATPQLMQLVDQPFELQRYSGDLTALIDNFNGNFNLIQTELTYVDRLFLENGFEEALIGWQLPMISAGTYNRDAYLQLLKSIDAVNQALQNVVAILNRYNCVNDDGETVSCVPVRWSGGLIIDTDTVNTLWRDITANIVNINNVISASIG